MFQLRQARARASHTLLKAKRITLQQASRSRQGGGLGSPNKVVFPPSGPLLIRRGFCVPC